MKEKDFVVATRPINGIEIDSVGIVNSTTVQYALVCFIGKNEVVRAPYNSLRIIDVGETGKGYPHKICNICHILKPMEEFDKNQTDAQGNFTTRPSCKICRQDIDGKKLMTAERKKMNERKPADKTVFVCPICEKRTIAGITVRVVADHDHKTGKGREWICDSCNTGLGRFKDDIAFFEKIIGYLEGFENDESDSSNTERQFS